MPSRGKTTVKQTPLMSRIVLRKKKTTENEKTTRKKNT